MSTPCLATPGSCQALFNGATTETKTSTSSAFDFDFFQKEKARFQSAILHGNSDLVTVSSEARPETLLALIEIRSDLSGFQFRMSESPELLSRRAEAWKRAFVQAHGKSGGNKIQFALMAIHNELHAPGWKGIVKSYLPQIEKALAARVQSEILANDLVTAFRNSGLIIDNVHGTKFAHRLYASGGLNWATQLAISALSPAWSQMVLGSGAGTFTPPFINGAKFEHLKKLTPELTEKIRNQGWGAAQAEIKRQFGTGAQASWAVNTSTRVFVMACTIMLLQSLYDDVPFMLGFVKAIYDGYQADLLADRLADRQKDGSNRGPSVTEMNADGLREQLVASWKDWYVSANHHEPSESEIVEARERMRKISDQKLLMGSGSSGT
jgi:hypothetical protein